VPLTELTRTGWVRFILDRPMANNLARRSTTTAQSHLLSALSRGSPASLPGICPGQAVRSARDHGLRLAPRSMGPIAWGGWGPKAERRHDMAKFGLSLSAPLADGGQQLLPRNGSRPLATQLNMNCRENRDLRLRQPVWARRTTCLHESGYRCQVIRCCPTSTFVAVTTGREGCPLGKLADAISGTVRSDTRCPLRRGRREPRQRHPRKISRAPWRDAPVKRTTTGRITVTVHSIAWRTNFRNLRRKRQIRAPSIRRSGPRQHRIGWQDLSAAIALFSNSIALMLALPPPRRDPR